MGIYEFRHYFSKKEITYIGRVDNSKDLYKSRFLNNNPLLFKISTKEFKVWKIIYRYFFKGIKVKYWIKCSEEILI